MKSDDTDATQVIDAEPSEDVWVDANEEMETRSQEAKPKLRDRIKEELPPLGILVIMNCIYFWKVLLNPGKLIYSPESDTVSQFFPWHLTASKAVENGEMPFWNPYNLGGEPLLANIQLAYFYPPNLVLFSIMPAHMVFGFSFYLHILFAGFSTYLLARHLKLDRYCALASGVIFMFSGYFIGHIYSGHYAQVCAASWLPMIFLLFDITIQKKKWSWGLLLGTAIGIQFLAGHLQMTLFALGMCGLYFIYFLVTKNLEKRDLKTSSLLLAILIPGAILAVVLSLIQLIPTYEMISLTTRNEGISYTYAVAYSYPPWSLVSLLLPNLFGNPVDGNYWNVWSYYEMGFYMGVPALFLVPLSYISRKDKFVRFFTGVGILAMILAMGKYTGIYWILWKVVPGFDVLRVPARFMIITILSVSILSGYGLSNLRAKLSNEQKNRSFKFIKAALITAFFLLGLVLLLSALYVPLSNIIKGLIEDLIRTPEYVERGHSIVQTSFMMGLVDIVILSVLLTAMALLIYWRMKMKDHMKWFSFAVIGLIFLNLGFYHIKFIDAKDLDDIYPEPGYIQYIMDDPGDFRVYDESEIIEDNFQIIYEMNTVGGYNPLRIHYYDALLETIHDLSNNHHHPILNMLGVKYILTSYILEDSGFDLVYKDSENRTGEGDPVYVYMNPEAFKGAFVVHKMGEMEEHDILETLQSDGFHPETTGLMESVPVPQSTVVNSSSNIYLTRDGFNEVNIDVDMSSNGYLILSQSYYPTWNVYVDGQEEELLRINYAFPGVYLEKGNHTVKFICEELVGY